MEILSYGFFQRALIAGVLLGLTCAVLSVFVVLRRMAFVGIGISHAALGGVALGLLVGLPPLAGAMIFAVGVGLAIAWLTGRGRISEDTAIGIFFPSAMALGVAIISMTPTYRQDLLGYLFGNILSVSGNDLWILGGLTGVSLGLLLFYYKELLFLGVDEVAARAAGLPVTGLRFLLLTLLAVTIVSAMKLVGIVLVSAFLVIPAATGQAVATSMRGMLVAAIASALGAVAGGLWISSRWDLPSGAAIVLLSASIFFVAYAVGAGMASGRG